MQNKSESNYMKNTKCPCLLKPFVSFYVIQVWSSSVPVIAWKKRDPIAFEQATQQIEELREQAARGEIILGYVDETGFSSTPDNRYAWTKIGDVHAVDAIRLKRVNVMGCLLSTGKLVTSCLQESVTSTWFYAYLNRDGMEADEILLARFSSHDSWQNRAMGGESIKPIRKRIHVYFLMTT